MSKYEVELAATFRRTVYMDADSWEEAEITAVDSFPIPDELLGGWRRWDDVEAVAVPSVAP